MSLRKEPALRFGGWVGAFAPLDLPVEEQPGIVTPSAQLRERGDTGRGDSRGWAEGN